MLASILGATGGGILVAEIVWCTLASLVCGAAIAGVYAHRNRGTAGLILTLALLPVMVQTVILLVNGNLGAGVAVMGAFSLVRFRSVPGGAREIACIFFAMAVGLATGMGYVVYAAAFTALVAGVMLLYAALLRRGALAESKSLRVTVPEDLDYTTAFNDLFARFAKRAELHKVRTTNLGSLFELHYTLTLKNPAEEKVFLDEIRKRNGNLNIVLGKRTEREDLL